MYISTRIYIIHASIMIRIRITLYLEMLCYRILLLIISIQQISLSHYFTCYCVCYFPQEFILHAVLDSISDTIFRQYFRQ